MIEHIRKHQLFQLTLAHLKEIIREPAVLFWGIGFPIIMSLGLGLAFTKKSDNHRQVALVNESNITHDVENNSLQLFNKISESNFSINSKTNTLLIEIENNVLGKSTFLINNLQWDEALILLKRGTIGLIIVIDKNEKISYHFDPANPDAQLSYMQLERVLTGHNKSLLSSSEKVKPLTIKGTRYIDFLIPGLMAMGLMMSTMWGLSYSLMEKRSKKLLRRLVATPMKKSYFLLSIISVRMLMNFFEALILLVVSILVFKVSIQGNILALMFFFFIGNLAFAGLAVLISSRTANTEIGNGIINAAVMPMMIMSGVFFSYHNFPIWAVKIIEKLPLTILADGVRSIFIEGASFQQIAIPSMYLLLFAAITFFSGLKIFRWH